MHYYQYQKKRHCKLVVTCRDLRVPNSPGKRYELILRENPDQSYPEEPDSMHSTSIMSSRKSYSCKICGKVAKRRANLVRHIQARHTHLPDDPLSYITWVLHYQFFLNRQCKLEITFREQLTSTGSHWELIAVQDPNQSIPNQTSTICGDKSYICEICGMATKRKANVVRHIKKQHPNLPEDPSNYFTWVLH